MKPSDHHTYPGHSIGHSALDERRLKRFRRLVGHAYRHAPYYTRLIDQLGIDRATCTPGDFPVLTKTVLMEHFDEIVTVPGLSRQVVEDFLSRSTDPRENLFDKYTVMHTSGTSGVVGYFLFATADRWRMARGVLRRRDRPPGRIRRRRPFVRSLRRLRLAFYGATGGHFAGVTAVARLQKGLPKLFVDARSFEVNTPLQSVLDDLNSFQPDILFGYTMALRLLGEQQRGGRLSIKPFAIAASGETCSKADMDFLSASFDQARVMSAYACTEHMMMGYSNPDGETMTLVDDNLFFEFFDDHLLVTNLFNHTMPLIRYRMSDVLEPVSPPGTSPVIVSNLVGRSERMPRFRNAAGDHDFLSPHTINEIFVKGVTRFQFRIKSETSFEFPICIEYGLPAEAVAGVVAGVKGRLREILAQKGLDNVSFEVPVVDEIPLNPRTRKFQLIVDLGAEA